MSSRCDRWELSIRWAVCASSSRDPRQDWQRAFNRLLSPPGGETVQVAGGAAEVLPAVHARQMPLGRPGQGALPDALPLGLRKEPPPAVVAQHGEPAIRRPAMTARAVHPADMARVQGAEVRIGSVRYPGAWILAAEAPAQGQPGHPRAALGKNGGRLLLAAVAGQGLAWPVRAGRRRQIRRDEIGPGVAAAAGGGVVGVQPVPYRPCHGQPPLPVLLRGVDDAPQVRDQVPEPAHPGEQLLRVVRGEVPVGTSHGYLGGVHVAGFI
jgi:hypothetical protein